VIKGRDLQIGAVLSNELDSPRGQLRRAIDRKLLQVMVVCDDRLCRFQQPLRPTPVRTEEEEEKKLP